jgi:transcriptional regulator with XRE-family HTH domain
MDPGELVRKMREERAIRSSEIERISRSIAAAEGNPEFFISHATLANIESSNSHPSIYKLFSLAVCFKIPYEQILLAFGVDPQKVDHYAGAPLAPSQTTLEPMELRDPAFRFQLNFDTRLNLKETNLIQQNLSDIGLAPAALLKRLDQKRYSYALIGLDDDTMGDIAPPGALVEIDKEQNKVEVFAWKTLRERPVYFVSHEGGYCCCWCQLAGNDLILLPHPISRRGVMRFKARRDASIIGRVIHVWTPLQRIGSPAGKC